MANASCMAARVGFDQRSSCASPHANVPTLYKQQGRMTVIIRKATITMIITVKTYDK